MVSIRNNGLQLLFFQLNINKIVETTMKTIIRIIGKHNRIIIKEANKVECMI